MSLPLSSIAVVFEAAISGQMILFAGVQAAGVGRVGPLSGVLSLLTGCLGVAVAVNALASLGIWTGLRDFNLLLELTSAAAIYTYAAHAFEGAAALTPRSGWNLPPPVLVFAGWKLGILGPVDAVATAVVAAYAVATAVTVFRQRARYRPQQIWWFVVLLAGGLSVLTLLRGLMIVEVQSGFSFRDAGAYTILLLLLLAMSSGAILIEMRYPNLLSAPSKHVRYREDALPNAALADLDRCFRTVMTVEKPYRNPEFGLADLARKLAVPERHLSQLANAYHRMTVPALLNVWRVEDAARQLDEPASTKAITTIMYDAGFGSKSAFQREFQKRFGMSPSAYRKRLR